MICTWNKQSLFTNLQCFLPHSEMSQIWPDKLHIAWWCSSAETQKSLIDCWAVLNYHVQAATNQDASQILVELHHLDHLEPLGKIACPGFGNNETLKEKWIILFGPQCVKLDLEVYNVCKLLCNSGSLMHFKQANIKPEPEESWYNTRRNQEYNAMRGRYNYIH